MTTPNRTALPTELCNEIRTSLTSKAFRKLVQTLRYNGKVFRVSIRPVEIKGLAQYQIETVDKGRVSLKNLGLEATQEALEEILTQPGARELHLLTADGDLHIRITRKGKALVSRGAPSSETRQVEHDHAKRQPLTDFDAATLLKVLGIADLDGRIKPSMRSKYDQINQFIRELSATLPEEPPESFVIVDCGCGKAYLTLAAYLWLVQVRHYTLQVYGIDSNPAIIASARQMAKQLQLEESVHFIQAKIADATLPTSPDAVFSLHACDTATDDALALACKHRARYILCAPPCCQHNIQQQMQPPPIFRPLIRQGILKERLADILADNYRAQLLRIFGYRVNIVEFVALEVSPRNLLIRAQLAVKPGQIQAIREYVELRDSWQVTPPLQERLKLELERLGITEL